MKKKVYSFICPHCGTVVSSKAPACPGCGSDKETGWSEKFIYAESPDPEENNASGNKKRILWLKYLVSALTMVLVSALLVALLDWGIYLVPPVLIIIGIAFYLTQVRPGTTRGMEKRLERQLLYMLNGDKEKADRLILYELMRKPGAKRLELLDIAIYRLKRDR